MRFLLEFIDMKKEEYELSPDEKRIKLIEIDEEEKDEDMRENE